MRSVSNKDDKFQSFYNPMVHLNTLQSDQAEKHLIGEFTVKSDKNDSWIVFKLSKEAWIFFV